MKRKVYAIISAALLAAIGTRGATPGFEPIPFGDFNNWVTRTLHESFIIGGHDKTVYAIGPTRTIDGNKAYVPSGGSPWATSNVYAHVSGVTKGSNAVYPEVRSGSDKCAKLCSELERVKALGIINMDVMVAGSVFLGKMNEPISSTKNPYSKMEVGMPYTKRPKALVFDYKVDMPTENTRIKSSGFGGKKTLQGRDTPVAFVLLQRRWETPDGNLHAKRVATGGEIFTKGTSSWVNGHQVPLVYGDVSADKNLSWLGLRTDNAYWARNSHGEMKPVVEEGWDSPDAVPTHVVVMFSAGNGEPYIGTPGLTFYVDNAGFLVK
ncbi:MAG: PCMD domain-containing protein [Clostridium sp.]|nr:PCMD domain-containing protein [Clostridium sp.]